MLRTDEQKKCLSSTPPKMSVHKIGGAYLQCVNNHYIKFEYKGMKTFVGSYRLHSPGTSKVLQTDGQTEKNVLSSRAELFELLQDTHGNFLKKSILVRASKVCARTKVCLHTVILFHSIQILQKKNLFIFFIII